MNRILLVILLFCTVNVISQDDDLRLISWNIRDFGQTKSTKELEHIAQIVKEADIVAIQEVVSGYGGSQAVAKLNEILNRTGQKWDYAVSDPTKSPKYLTERYAYLWKTKHIKVKDRGRLLDELESFVDREPHYMEFYIQGRSFVVLNYHSRRFNKNPELEIEPLLDFVIDSIQNKSIILAGDFNMSEQDSIFKPLFDHGFDTAIKNQKTTLKRTCVRQSYLNYPNDNIFYSSNIEATKRGVLDFVKICENLKKARELSDHLPVFITFRLTD